MQKLVLVAALLAVSASPSLAHLSPEEHGSLLAGLTHPLSGLDHILAMLTVGLWAASLGGRALWLVPSAFVAAMGVGFALALGGVALPFVEPAILASVVVLGLLVAIAVRVPVGLGMAVVAAFALFHGFAHGGELGTARALDYGLGFALATALLHVLGIGLGFALSRFFGEVLGLGAGRAMGALAALAGVTLAVLG